jgi:hypothetical protein
MLTSDTMTVEEIKTELQVMGYEPTGRGLARFRAC